MTHERIEALDKLIAAVEAGDLTDVNRKLGVMFATDHSLAWDWVSNVNSAFRGSLDASKALHEELLPDLLWEITPLGNVYIRDIEYNQLSRAFVTSNPARAWLIAILKAYRSTLST